MRSTHGFNLIEMTVSIAVITIIGAVTGGLLITFIQSQLKTVTELESDRIATVILDTMMEGDLQAGGLRAAQDLITTTATTLVFLDSADRQVEYTYNGSDAVQRAIGAGSPLTDFPVELDSVGARVTSHTFAYFGEQENLLTAPVTPQAVRRVEVTFTVDVPAATGEEGQVTAKTSAAVLLNR